MILYDKELFILVICKLFLLSNCQLKFDGNDKDENELRTTENEQIIDIMTSKVTKLVLSALVEDFFTHMLHYSKHEDAHSTRNNLEEIVRVFKFSDPSIQELQDMKTKIFTILDRDDVKDKPVLSEHLITKYEDIVEYLKEKLLYLQDLLNTAKSKKNYNVIKSLLNSKSYLDITSFFFHLYEDIKSQQNKISDQKIKEIILSSIKHEMEVWDKPRYKRSADFYESSYSYDDPSRYIILPDIDKEKIKKEVEAMFGPPTQKPDDDNKYMRMESSKVVRKKVKAKSVPKFDSSEESNDQNLEPHFKSNRFNLNIDEEENNKYSDPNYIDDDFKSQETVKDKKTEPKYEDEDHYNSEKFYMGKAFDQPESRDEYYDLKLLPDTGKITLRKSKFPVFDRNSKKKFWLCTTENNVKTITSSENILIPIALNKMFNDYFLYYTKSIKRNNKINAHRLVTAPTNMQCKVIERNFFNIKESLLYNLIQEIKIIKNLHV